MFVTCCDAAWANLRFLTVQCGFRYAATEETLMDHSAPCKPHPVHTKNCPRVAPNSSSAEAPGAAQVKMRWSMCSCCGTNWNVAQWTFESKTKSQLDAKGVFDAVSRSDSAGLSMAD